jgi:hypothetical protein
MFGILQGRPLNRIGARAALAAIAAHLILSFGHVHLPTSPSHPSAGVTLPAPSDGPQTPAHKDDDGCAICANIAAFASMDLPAPLAIPVVARWTVAIIPMISVWSAPTTPYRLFHTRAPPAGNR